MSSVWPTNEQILSGMTGLANAWRPLAILWHVYFAAFIVTLVLGVRPSRRVSGVLLALPFLSVSILAWSIMNPFNGIIFAVVGILLIAVSARLPNESIQVPSLWGIIPGAFMFIFGWVYPYFLDASSPLSFLYSAPIGIIPCATLSIGIGLTMILNSLGSRKPSLILGITGIIFGVTGVVQLSVTIDLFLLLGSVAVLVFALREIKVYGRMPFSASSGAKANR